MIDILWKGRRWLLLSMSAPGHCRVGWAASKRVSERENVQFPTTGGTLSLSLAGSAKFPQAVANVKDYACLLFPQRLLLRGPENQHTHTPSFLPPRERARLRSKNGAEQRLRYGEYSDFDISASDK